MSLSETTRSTGASVPEELSEAPVGDDNIPTVLKKLQKWGDYETMGTPVEPTKFIPMKTPISEELVHVWGKGACPRHMHTIKTMLDEQRRHGRIVGLILDLSNHDCLYTEDLEADGTVQYEHIHLVAKELPSRECVDRVIEAANAYWAENPDRYIAIHCTYGYNRTGFVVASYLIQHLEMSVETGLARFAEARAPGVKHEIFKAELRRRYEGGPDPARGPLDSDPSAATSAVDRPSSPSLPPSLAAPLSATLRLATNLVDTNDPSAPLSDSANLTDEDRDAFDDDPGPPPLSPGPSQTLRAFASPRPHPYARLSEGWGPRGGRPSEDVDGGGGGGGAGSSSKILAGEGHALGGGSPRMSGGHYPPLRSLLPGKIAHRLRGPTASQESFGEFSEEDYSNFYDHCNHATKQGAAHRGGGRASLEQGEGDREGKGGGRFAPPLPPSALLPPPSSSYSLTAAAVASCAEDASMLRIGEGAGRGREPHGSPDQDVPSTSPRAPQPGREARSGAWGAAPPPRPYPPPGELEANESFGRVTGVELLEAFSAERLRHSGSSAVGAELAMGDSAGGGSPRGNPNSNVNAANVNRVRA